MQRIPNPGSDINIFIRIFRDIYPILSRKQIFGLDDISLAMSESNNVTSQGAIGAEALRRSTRVDRSRDPMYNQSKMYAELYRTLGWIQSTTSKLIYSFSLLGDHIARGNNPAPLMKECLLGLAYPNEVLGVQGVQQVRVIGGIILVMDALGSITRDEMIAGPMSISDDKDIKKYTTMVKTLAYCRENPDKLDELIDKIATARAIKRIPTMENYTRFPIAVLPWAGWGTKIRGKITITKEGKTLAAQLRESPDIRLTDFNNFPDAAKPSFIRWTFYSMLARAGYDISSKVAVMKLDQELLLNYGIPHNQNIFFSPFQQLSRESLKKWTPELVPEELTPPSQLPIVTSKPYSIGTHHSIQKEALIFELSDSAASTNELATDIAIEIKEFFSKTSNLIETEEAFLLKYKYSNKDIFYPLVASLFRVIGFDCRVSRGGQNYDRADAIIISEKNCIPIEIKSPGEETEISVKGVRQALENKIIFLSRKSYPTDMATTSLVVGFNPPNKRSEVMPLIQDIKNAFDIRIAVIDFRTLLSLAIQVVVTGKMISLQNFYHLQGVIHARNIRSE